MALIPYGILGYTTKKVGNVVGTIYKDTNVLKAHYRPTGSPSTAQLVRRATYSQLLTIFRLLKSSVMQPVWDPLYSQMSGWNGFLKNNLLLMPTGFDWDILLITDGSLEQIPLLSSTYNPSTGAISFTWSNQILTNGLPDDAANCLVIDSASSIYFLNSTASRSAGTVTFNIGTGRLASQLKSYIYPGRAV